jgi:GAF domain-containing protein
MINTVRNFFTPPVFNEDENKSRIVGVLFRILTAIYILLPTAILIQILNPGIGRFYLPIAFIITILTTVLFVIAKRGYVRAASMALIISFLILSTIMDISAKGTPRPIGILAGAAIVAGGLLLGPRGSYTTAILYGIKHLIVLFLIHNNLISPTATSPVPTPFIDGTTTFVAYIMVAIVFTLASNSLYSALTRIRQSEGKLTASNQQLQELTQNLENRIKERVIDLENASILSEKRARQFEAITRISSTITSVQNLQELLPRISEVISNQFGFYHTGIFLTDISHQYAVLSAANSEGGKKMLKRSHQLKIGEQGIVGYVTGTGNPRVALNVGEDIVFFNNPDLPETHSEMALPLKIAGNVIGALDVQSTEPNAFSTEDINVLSTLADQVSLAIQNARLFDQSTKLLSEYEAIQHQYLRETWSRLPQEENLAGFRYSAIGATQIDNNENLPPVDNNTYNEIITPISIRGETIGSLSIHIPQHERVTTDQMDLIKAVAERVALSAENARLFEETSRRASRESLVSDITTKIRGTNNPQEMIKTAMDELQRALGATRIEIIPQKKQAVP